ncbi:Dynamin-3 [Thelohanellus kitauei]|uniref:Dynamin-3 n=1 Tax=Thelohanellus kitauei TaxID=669202 RepID=A0A0C2J1G6_THEKT|nr:Dynamin-3 [Thelohanellus kitauei]
MTLTLIDLPGVTKIAMGEQPDDICTKTREMIKKAISNPNCIILAVIPAVTDVYNSEALKLSQEVDPNRLRTIGVVTKVDMMNEVKNCFNVLTNKAYPLARGFVGVVNRSQKDIVQNKDMATAKADETKFFEEHPVYRSLGDRVGSGFLQKTLIEILAVHIKKILPKIKQSIMEQLAVIKTIIDDNPALNLDTDCTDTFPHEFLIL